MHDLARSDRPRGLQEARAAYAAESDDLGRATRAESRLRDAIESIRAGFALFDEHDRLVI
jgi:hypothetical protein